ncbi:MAG: hypothetical protein OEO79_08800 [Gemmatimonadota bacterium]|nr:hypothetical protein [Gemmatimonadota bacterium]
MTELGVVILGVMIALAADSWREGLLDSRVASEYQMRLREDVSQSMIAIRLERERFSAARAAAMALTNDSVTAFGSSSGAHVDDLIVAGAMGLDREQLGSEVTYQELVASGQLALLSGPARSALVAHYNQMERLWVALRDLAKINVRVTQLTGYNPIEFVAYGRSLTEADRARLSEALENDTGLRRELRQLHGDLVFAERLFDEVLEGAQHLVRVLE